METKTEGLCTRSTTRKDLLVPKTLRTYCGDHAFSATTTVLWNNLPKHVKDANSVDIFYTRLKTQLFRPTCE
ncbi:hypothetical protein LOTGIDRAFT_139884 [Lottia gigantea]|uniref:Uncharacterized protein n=1 Tax=Lottia gigantea TaxID=225164 RepID=V4AV23_LOTGI|nr:hypothetical protein LOTGIDRAFT_139884 [Lottia gigantea]ESP01153.1 hypothetical protein LOTGIDRAFT_139884 [Lottia gigantea]